MSVLLFQPTNLYLFIRQEHNVVATLLFQFLRATVGGPFPIKKVHNFHQGVHENAICAPPSNMAPSSALNLHIVTTGPQKVRSKIN